MRWQRSTKGEVLTWAGYLQGSKVLAACPVNWVTERQDLPLAKPRAGWGPLSLSFTLTNRPEKKAESKIPDSKTQNLKVAET